jgi:hypothetical protein
LKIILARLRFFKKKRVRDRVQTDVDCNAQQIDYCKTYHHIDKGNGAEGKYDMLTESHLHGWRTKLAAGYSNINLNNAYKIFCFLYKKHHPKGSSPRSDFFRTCRGGAQYLAIAQNAFKILRIGITSS